MSNFGGVDLVHLSQLSGTWWIQVLMLRPICLFLYGQVPQSWMKKIIFQKKTTIRLQTSETTLRVPTLEQPPSVPTAALLALVEVQSVLLHRNEPAREPAKRAYFVLASVAHSWTTQRWFPALIASRKS